MFKKSTSVDVRRSKLPNIPENSPFLKMTSGKHLGSTPIMTSSVVPLNICGTTEKFYITCEQLGSPWGTGPAARAPRRVCWHVKFFFEFWPPILQSKTPIRIPTPALTRHQGFVLLTYFDDCLLHHQGHPTTVFCKISVRKSKNRLKFSFALRRLKISRWMFHSCTVFEAYLINPLRFSKV